MSGGAVSGPPDDPIRHDGICDSDPIRSNRRQSIPVALPPLRMCASGQRSIRVFEQQLDDYHGADGGQGKPDRREHPYPWPVEHTSHPQSDQGRGQQRVSARRNQADSSATPHGGHPGYMHTIIFRGVCAPRSSSTIARPTACPAFLSSSRRKPGESRDPSFHQRDAAEWIPAFAWLSPG